MANKSSSGEGHWVTINGTHVFIGGNGRVQKGPKKLIGYTKDKNAKKHTGRSSASTKSSKKSTSTSKKTSSSSGISYYNPTRQVSPTTSRKQSKPKFYDKNNYKQLYSESQLNKYYTHFESGSPSSPKKSGKTENLFTSKPMSKAEMRAIESMKDHEYAMVKAQGLDPIAYVKNRDKQVKQKTSKKRGKK